MNEKRARSLNANFEDGVHPKPQRNHQYGLLTFSLLIIVFILMDILIKSVEVKKSDNAHDLEEVLRRNVHGQNEALRVIIDSTKNLEGSVKVLNFFGPTGVGKTYIANLLTQFFPYHIQSIGALTDSFEKTLNKIFNNNYSSNLLIFDDLNITNLDGKFMEFLNKLPTGTLVICIFNIQETDNGVNYRINYGKVAEISEQFQGVAATPVLFQELSREQALNWMRTRLNIEDYGVLETVLAQQDLGVQGFKGLSSKLKLHS